MMLRGAMDKRRHDSVPRTTRTTTAAAIARRNVRSASSDAIMCSSITTDTSTPSSASPRPVTPAEGADNDTFMTNGHGERSPDTTTADATTNANTTTSTSIETSVGTPHMSGTQCDTRRRSDRRREKLRLFRRDRSEDRRQVSTAGTITSSLPSDTGSSDGDSIDTLGSLYNEPPHMIMSRMISPPTTITTTSNIINNDNNTAPVRRHSPPATMPGAVAARGRAFGEIPQWARTPARPHTNPATTTTATNATTTTPSTSTPSTDNNNDTPTANNNNTTPSHVSVLRRSISDRSRSVFASMYPGRPTRVIRSTSGNSNRSPRRPSVPLLSQSTGSTSFFGNVGNLLSSFRSMGQSLPEAEILDSEKVVYAEVVEPQDEWTMLLRSLTLFIYSILLLLVGIMIGRWTEVPSLADASGHTHDL